MKGVSRNPDVMHGQPCIAGTRIPTEGIANLRRSGYSETWILSQFPVLTSVEQVRAAVRYERSWQRRAEHATWRIRFRLASWLAGYDVEKMT